MEVRVQNHISFSAIDDENQRLLDFSGDFDVALMDKIVMALYTGAGQEVCQVALIRYSTF